MCLLEKYYLLPIISATRMHDQKFFQVHLEKCYDPKTAQKVPFFLQRLKIVRETFFLLVLEPQTKNILCVAPHFRLLILFPRERTTKASMKTSRSL
jgi:hypothetical protein